MTGIVHYIEEAGGIRADRQLLKALRPAFITKIASNLDTKSIFVTHRITKIREKQYRL